MIVWRDASSGDSVALAALFEESFIATFGHLYRAEDLAAFLHGHTADRWDEQIADPAYAIRLAEADGVPIALIKLGPPALPVDRPRPAIELRQLYVAAGHHGSGIAQTAMAWAIDEARRRGAADLFLSVYVDNHRARRFYERYGFARVGRYAFMVGAHEDEDDLMRLEL